MEYHFESTIHGNLIPNLLCLAGSLRIKNRHRYASVYKGRQVPHRTLRRAIRSPHQPFVDFPNLVVWVRMNGWYLLVFLPLGFFSVLVSALPREIIETPRASENIYPRSVTPLSSIKLAEFAPYTQLARAAYCNPSKTRNWGCGREIVSFFSMWDRHANICHRSL